MLTISKAAIRHVSGKVWSVPRPLRHHHIFPHICESMGIPTVGGKDFCQGFMTSDGVFVTRDIAERIARRAGQIKGEDQKIIGGVLTSEDLW